MKISQRFTSLVVSLLAVSLFSETRAQQADYDDIGRHMAVMLQNSHYAQFPFDEQLSERFLDHYLRDLDPQKLYFTRKDVDKFKSEYGNRIHTMLLSRESMVAANSIYDVYEMRVNSRVAHAKRLLAEGFDFTQQETTSLNRKNSEWPKDEAEAANNWRKAIKEAVLAEIMRRDLVSKHAKEQGKEDPGLKDKSPQEKVALRYKRLQSSVMDADEEDVANRFLSAIARSYDPHTEYMSARESDKFKGDMKNELIGIGALLKAEDDGATKIIGIVVGGPADREGTLRLNDRIVGVDSLDTGKAGDMVDVMFMDIEKVVDLIRGKEGTTVALKVEPAAGAPGETKIIEIPRGRVEMKDEKASGELIQMNMGDGQPMRRIGVIKLPSFYADFDEGKVRCSVDVERILKRLIDEKIDGLVVDLRNNGGGSLEEVRRMTGFFIGEGPVVQVRRAQGQVQVKNSDAEKPIYTGPMVVMTDKASASASEILAGALQDTNRAVIVGESSTFGKGTVQQMMDISRMFPIFSVRDRAGNLKLTIQKFYRPSGSSTQLEGVVPDIVLPSVMDALEVGEKYLDHALPHDRIRSAPDLQALDRAALFVPRLREDSAERVKSSKDFGYIIEDTLKMRKRVDENTVQLNMEARLKEIQESDERQKARKEEMRQRFRKVADDDKNKFKFFKLDLASLDVDAPIKEYDPSEENTDFMKRAKDADAELDDMPKWPSGLDPVKRESLMILNDFVGYTESARLAGTLPAPTGRQ